MSYNLIPATIGDILVAAKAALIRVGLGTTNTIAIRAQDSDEPPISPAEDEVVWAVAPAPDWQRDFGVQSESSEVILTGQIIVSCWANSKLREELGSEESVLTGSTFGVDTQVRQLITNFDFETQAAWLADNPPASNGSTPLMEPLQLLGLTMPKTAKTNPWRGFHARFFCRFRLRTS